MSPRWTKLWRDAQAARGRLATIVIALAASLVAVTTMLAAFTVLTREVPSNYRSTNPASAQIELGANIDAALLDQVRRQPGIGAAEAGASLLARVEVAPGQWMPLLVFVVDRLDASRIQKLHPEAGAWPPPDGTLLVERSALPLTNRPLGQPLNAEWPHGGRRAVVLSGSVHDPGLAPAWQEQTVYAYATPQTLAALGEPTPLNLLKIVVEPGGDDRDVIEQVTGELARWLVAQGQEVRAVRVPTPRQHPHQAQMNAVLWMLLVFSLLGMVLGAVLTATVIGGLLSQQVRQLAILKAIGARSSQIAGLYFSLVGLLGLAAVAIGLPLGLLLGRGLIGGVAQLLNLRIESQALPGWLFAAVLALGLLAPLLAAAGPIVNASRRTVRSSMDDHGVGRSAAGWVRHLPFASAPLALALRNTFRHRLRLASTLLLLAGAGAMFITSLDLKAAWEDMVRESAADRHFDLEIVLQAPADAARVAVALSRVAEMQRWEAWNAASASVADDRAVAVQRSHPDGAHGGFALRSAPVETALAAHRLSEGRWLRPDDRDAVVVNAMARSLAFGRTALGDWVTLTVDGRSIRLQLVGVVNESLTPGAAYVTPATFDQATQRPGQVNALRFVVADRARVEAVSRQLVQALEAAGAGVRVSITEQRFATAQSGHVYILVAALGFIACTMAVVGLLGLASTLGAAVAERTREFGVLRALGARSAAVLQAVVFEGLCIALLSWGLALLLSLPLSARVGQVLASIAAQSLVLHLSLPGALLWLVLLLGGAALVSWHPARRASRLTVRQTLAF